MADDEETTTSAPMELDSDMDDDADEISMLSDGVSEIQVDEQNEEVLVSLADAGLMSDDLFQNEAQIFQKRSRKVGAKKKAKKKKKAKTVIKVDDVFTDMENMLNVMSALLVACEPAMPVPMVQSEGEEEGSGAEASEPSLPAFFSSCPKATRLLPYLPFLFVVYTVMGLWTVGVVIPTCFVLLVARSKTIETKVAAFSARQTQLREESAMVKSLRCVSLSLRTLPILTLLVVWPAVSVFVVIPTFNASQTVVISSIGAQMLLLLILLCLGVRRSLYSFNQRKKEAMDAQPSSFVASHVARADRFRWLSLGNLLAILSLTLESGQSALFAFSSPPPPPTAPPNATQSMIGKMNATEFGTSLHTLADGLFVNVAADTENGLRSHLMVVYTSFGSGVVALLLIIVAGVFLQQLRRFAILKRNYPTGSPSTPSPLPSDNAFFFSLPGAMIYGHGKAGNVSNGVVTIVVILSDALFMVVIDKLMKVLYCAYPESGTPFLVLAPDVQCWQGPHAWCAFVALVSLSFYMPLCAMIGPLLAEQDEGKKDGKNDVSYAQPYRSAVTVAKCALFVGATLFAANPIVPTICACAVYMFLFGTTVHWSALPFSPHHSRLTLHAPCLPPAINIWRSVIYALGFWGAVVALVVQLVAIQDRYLMLLASVGWSTLLLGGVVTFICWKRGNRDLLALLNTATTEQTAGDVELDIMPSKE